MRSPLHLQIMLYIYIYMYLATPSHEQYVTRSIFFRIMLYINFEMTPFYTFILVKCEFSLSLSDIDR